MVLVTVQQKSWSNKDKTLTNCLLFHLFYYSKRNGVKTGGASGLPAGVIAAIVVVIGFVAVCALVLGLIPVYLSKI